MQRALIWSSLRQVGAKARTRAHTAGETAELIEAFEYAADPPNVIIDMSRAHVWDVSAVAALDAIEMHYARHDVELRISGLNAQSHELHTAFSGRTAAAHAWT